MALETIGVAGTIAVLVYFGAVALSLPAAAAVLLVARRYGVARAAVVVTLAAAVLLVILSVAVATIAGPGAGLLLCGVGLGALAGLWAIPVAVGAALVRRFVGLTPDGALGFAVAGLPPAMILSAIVFLAPGGPTRYNLTFLSGPALWVAGAVFVSVVFLGPGVAGTGLARLAARRSAR